MGDDGLSGAVRAALDAERVRNLRWLSWLRLIANGVITVIMGGFVLRGHDWAIGQFWVRPVSVVAAVAMLWAAYRSRWYVEGGWMPIGAWDFVALWGGAYLGIERARDAAEA